MSETIDAKLARIGARVAERSGNVRERLARDPYLLDACERSRQMFVSAPGTRQTKLIWLQDSEGEMGRKP